jgi:hypothetical protein
MRLIFGWSSPESHILWAPLTSLKTCNILVVVYVVEDMFSLAVL